MNEFLIESQCLPPVPTYQILRQNDAVKIEIHENYQKRSFRNRFYLAGPNGVNAFTIPLAKGKNQKQKISKVQVAYDEDWIRNLSGLLQTNYGSAPFFHHYIDSLMDVFKKEEPYLLNLNMNLLNWTLKTLRIETPILTSLEYRVNTEEAQDMRNTFTPKTLKSYEANVIYNQVYEERGGFIPNLSILDMIMCCGPESASILQY